MKYRYPDITTGGNVGSLFENGHLFSTKEIKYVIVNGKNVKPYLVEKFSENNKYKGLYKYKYFV